MQVGDLVRITRASVSVPKNTVGLIVKVRVYDRMAGTDMFSDYADRHNAPPTYDLFHVQLATDTELNGKVRRYLLQDLRKIS